MEYDALTFIGRFQPFHNGHASVVQKALDSAKLVVMVIGSHETARNIRNPFTTDERIQMISACFPNEVAQGRIVFVPQIDYAYNDKRWISSVQSGVNRAVRTGYGRTPKVGLIGHSKDHTSFYLKCFPEWDSIEVDNVSGINATDIRVGMFTNLGPAWGREWTGSVPAPILKFAFAFSNTAEYQALKKEFDFIKKYKDQWKDSPYPPIFHTVDAVVVQSNHILLVQRGAMPGKGQWALPGGFVEVDERLEEAMLRELRQETSINLSDSALRGRIRAMRTYDDPNRSLRGRTITTAYYIDLIPREELPRIKGSDDAAHAMWVPLASLQRELMYEDHMDIIADLVGI